MARLIRTIRPPWRGRAVASTGQGASQRNAVAFALLGDAVSTPAVWVPDVREGLSVAERSPPTIGRSRNADPAIGARATPVDTCLWRPAVPALGEENSTSLHAQ